jgi:Helicase conserved C-terminal domain/SNF2-related domain
MPQHPIQRLYLAEDLVRRRRADEHRRSVASQRAGRIDPNPHQIEAVVFALARLPEGGCILADEVGLGKTIEAGLVIAQLLAEGARRILVVTPKSLLGQWKQELFSLFGIDAREVLRDAPSFQGEGVFLGTRDLVGSESGAALLQASDRFDLCVIDEAHEVFAGIYRRFDREGGARDDSPYARMASRLSRALGAAATPVVLLTATPMQNSLAELWGLVQYVDPTGTLLGDLATFRQIFCASDDRVLAEGQEHELQERLGIVLRRTLRRQAQEFMSEPFMDRQARLFEYLMSTEERQLYDDVTRYLLEPSLYAFSGRQRTLLLLGFHRRMASSLAALSASLDNVAARLRGMRDGRPPDESAERAALLGDLEDDDDTPADDAPPPTPEDAAAISAELSRVEFFALRARALPTDGKALALLRAIKLVFEQAALGKSSGKLVIFTESLTTQDYLRTLLLQSRLVGDEDITLFRGTNDSPRAREALERWLAEVGHELPPGSRPTPDVAVRLALVHEFRHRSRILISTEAGAKGLNLQFCDTVLNYDLPWNPQRIEQRIGRCHRYGQHRDVTVINFIARDNEAQRLTFEILSQKLELFGTVLGASDEVLHRPGSLAPEALASALGADFEIQLRRIYDRSRTIEEVERELRALRDLLGSKRQEFEAAQGRTADVIERRFDVTVKQVFRRIQEELPRELAEFDRHIEGVVVGFLEATGVPYRLDRRDGSAELVVAPSPRLPPALRDGTACLIGGVLPGSPLVPLHLGHPLVQAALEDIRSATRGLGFSLRIEARSAATSSLRGRRGRLRLVRVQSRGFESAEQLLPVAVLDGTATPLAPELARQLLQEPMSDVAALSAPSGVSDATLADAVEELLFLDGGDAGAHEQPRFERTLEQLERFIGDRVLILERRHASATSALLAAEAARDGAIGAEQRGRAEQALRRAQEEIERLDAEIARLRAGEDDNYQRWRRHAHERRYAPPVIEQLVDAEFEVA